MTILPTSRPNGNVGWSEVKTNVCVAFLDFPFAAGKIFENSLDRIPKPSDARLAVAYFRIHSDSGK